MTRKEYEDYILDTYGVRADYPFEEDFETGVFRHTDSRKWFSIAMKIKKSKLGLEGQENIDIANLKCDPEIIESIAGVERGVYRAYHMNKLHWLTVALDGSCDDETVKWLLQISYDLTRKAIKK